jgi:hypothetical protein
MKNRNLTATPHFLDLNQAKAAVLATLNEIKAKPYTEEDRKTLEELGI